MSSEDQVKNAHLIRTTYECKYRNNTAEPYSFTIEIGRRKILEPGWSLWFLVHGYSSERTQ